MDLADVRYKTIVRRRAFWKHDDEKAVQERRKIEQIVLDGPKLHILKNDDLRTVSLVLHNEGHQVILDHGRLLGTGSFGTVYKFALPEGPVAIKIQQLNLNVAFYPDAKKLALSESLLEPVALQLLQKESTEDTRHMFPAVHGSYIMQKEEGDLVMVVIEEWIDGATLESIANKDKIIDLYEKIDDYLAMIKANSKCRISDLDVAPCNIMVTVDDDIVFVDHGYTTFEKVNGWWHGQIEKIALYHGIIHDELH